MDTFAPDNVDTIKGVITAFGQQPHGTALMADNNFNANLEEMKGKFLRRR